MAINADGNFSRLAQSGPAGIAHQISSIGLPDNKVITAIRDGSGKLVLTSWNINPDDGELIRLGDSFGEDDVKIGLVSIVAISSNTVLTVIQDSNEDLMLISWRFNADGNFSRLAESGPAGIAHQISSIGLPDNKVITAIRDGSGKLVLTSWNINPDDGQLYSFRRFFWGR